MNSTLRDDRYIQFSCDRAHIDLRQILDLFQTAAFWARDRRLEDLEIAIANSDPVVTVWDGNHTVGFARATSDGVYRATIWDVVIHPDYQGGGLGRKLVQTVLGHPKLCRVERVYLMTSRQQKFYERIGFEYNPTTTFVLSQSEPVPLFSHLEFCGEGDGTLGTGEVAEFRVGGDCQDFQASVHQRQ
ncbi:GNAT family N-acetyltransferase [Lyngbya sp. CCY1209]|uniref:GNAT family N-acetyltransferase n=1 Tax=Lyngbya sp. CCY1209 TaxID=2886103 RepID=UPI002D20A404|nr:GNAT family N-acetyltransferase [Lyngbya sp. CCY1209]MEB3881810.1 GNAT family N-acetyltransferase [Lyngbya sp. CCY1209]